MPRKPVARPMSGRTYNSTCAFSRTRAQLKSINQLNRETGFERVEDPSRVEGSALPAGGPKEDYTHEAAFRCHPQL